MDANVAEVLARRRKQTEDSQNAGVSMIEPGSGGSSFSPPRKNSTASDAPRSGPTMPGSNSAGAATGAATGAGMAALALGNESLRKAAEESSVGTGGLFARPTPAQMLRGMGAKQSPPKPKAPVQATERITESAKSEAPEPPTQSVQAADQPMPGLGAYATKKNEKAAQEVEPGSNSAGTAAATGDASRSGPTMPGSNSAGAATGAGMAALALGNESLRKAAEESSVGAGGLFARPTPAQMLRGMGAKQSPPKPKAPVQTTESITESAKSEAPEPPGLGAYASKKSEETDQEVTPPAPARPKQKSPNPPSQGKEHQAKQAAPSQSTQPMPGLGAYAGAQKADAGPKQGAAVEADPSNLSPPKPAPEYSSIGAGGLFARPTPAQLLRANGEKVAPKKKAPEEHAEPQTDAPKSAAANPPMPGLGAYAEPSNESDEPTIMHMPRRPEVSVLPAPEPAAPITPLIAEAIQIGKLNTVLEDDEEDAPYSLPPSQPSSGITPLPSDRRLGSSQSATTDAAIEGAQEAGPAQPDKSTSGPLSTRTQYNWKINSGATNPPIISHPLVGLQESSDDESDDESEEEAETSEEEEADTDDVSVALSESRKGSVSSEQSSQPSEMSQHEPRWWEKTASSGKPKKPKRPAGSLLALPIMKGVPTGTPPSSDAEGDSDPESAPATLADADRERTKFYEERKAALASLAGKIERTSDLPGQLEAVLTKGLVQPLHSPEQAEAKGAGAHARAESGEAAKASPSKKGTISWTQYARDRAKHLAELVDEADVAGGEDIRFQLKPGVHDVILWLRNAGWGQYEETFAVNQIDFDELFSLEERDLKDMGMKLANNRRNLLHQIAALKGVWLSEIKGEKAIEDKREKEVFVKGKKDKHEAENASLIAAETEYEQKRGYITYSKTEGKKWKRGYAVLQGAMFHLFKTSDHITLKPLLSRSLHGAIITLSDAANHAIHIQANPAAPSRKDLLVAAADEEECQEWQQQCVAAANLQMFKQVFGQNRPAPPKNPTVLVLVEEVAIRRGSPLVNPSLSVFVTDRMCNPIKHFDAVPLGQGTVEPDEKGVLHFEPQGQILLKRELRASLGAGAFMFFECRQMVASEDGGEESQAQYWAYTPIDKLKNGALTLDWLKRPTVLDPSVLGKQKIPKKDKSALVLTVRSTEPADKEPAKPKEKKAKKSSGGAEHAGLEQAVSYLISLLQNALPDPDQLGRVSAFLRSLQAIANPASSSEAPADAVTSAISALAADDSSSSAGVFGGGGGGRERERAGPAEAEAEGLQRELARTRARCDDLEAELAALRASLADAPPPPASHQPSSLRGLLKASTPPPRRGSDTPPVPPLTTEWEFTGPEDQSLYSSAASRASRTVDPAGVTLEGAEEAQPPPQPTSKAAVAVPVEEIQEELESRGASLDGGVERADLLEKLQDAQAQAGLHATRAASSGSVGSGVGSSAGLGGGAHALAGGSGKGAGAAGKPAAPKSSKISAPKSSAAGARPDVPEPVWGECYGETGEVGKGQKGGWVELRMQGKKWEKVYAKRARNTLLLFASAEDLSSPSSRLCLDGVVIFRSQEEAGHPYAVGGRKSLFEHSKQDFVLAAASDKDATSWEKALMKGVVWHGEQRAKAGRAPAPPLTTGAPSPAAPPPAPQSAPVRAPPAAPASAPAGGLASQLLSGVGHTFTFKKKPKPPPQPPTSSHTPLDPDTSAAMAAGWPADTSDSAAAETLESSVGATGVGSSDGGGNVVTVQLVRMGVARKAGESFNNPVLHLTARGSVGGKHVSGAEEQEVAVRGLPGDGENTMTIAATRTVQLAGLQGAADQSLYFEFRHQKPNKVSTRAWAFMPLHNLYMGDRELVMYEKPVVLGPRAARASPLKGFSLTLRVLECPTVM